MVYTIQEGCIACGNCFPQCPNGAIKPDPVDATSSRYWIDPTLCDGCQTMVTPYCVEACDVGSLIPLQAKKGRCKSSLLPAAVSSIFLNGKTTPFASAMVIWETCNVLAQRQSLPWETDPEGKLCYRRSVHRDRGQMQFRIAADPEAEEPVAMPAAAAQAAIAAFDLRATGLHLIFAAYAITCDRPWEEAFVLNDQQIETYLGLDKRKDLTKLEKLRLLKDLVYQACRVLVTLDWPRQGKVPAFQLAEQPVWHLLDTQYYFEVDAQGCRRLIGLGFTVRAGIWAKYFLNKQQYRRQTAFYQYSTLPQSLLSEIMGHWQQHEGAVRLLVWLLFKLRLRGNHRITVRTLLRIAYGEARVHQATTVRGAHKRLLKSFESDLETLYYYGLKPRFDPESYPPDIQPLWARVADIPEDAEAALEFWTEDAHQDFSLTDAAPRDKWQRLLNARLLGFDLPETWQQTPQPKSTKRRRQSTKPPSATQPLSGSEIKAARQRQQISQRMLAQALGKSQSWIRDIEKGRFSLGPDDQVRLRQALKL